MRLQPPFPSGAVRTKRILCALVIGNAGADNAITDVSSALLKVHTVMPESLWRHFPPLWMVLMISYMSMCAGDSDAVEV